MSRRRTFSPVGKDFTTIRPTASGEVVSAIARTCRSIPPARSPEGRSRVLAAMRSEISPSVMSSRRNSRSGTWIRYSVSRNPLKDTLSMPLSIRSSRILRANPLSASSEKGPRSATRATRSNQFERDMTGVSASSGSVVTPETACSTSDSAFCRSAPSRNSRRIDADPSRAYDAISSTLSMNRSSGSTA